MSKYGIKLIWGRGEDDDVIGFTDASYKKWKDKIPVGTRILLYETVSSGGVGGIVSEVEVIADFDASAGMPTPTSEHDHPLHVKIIRGKKKTPVISMEQVRTELGRSKYPMPGDTWVFITEKQYKEFIKFWDGR